MSKKHIGIKFDEFLAEEALHGEATATAVKRVVAWLLKLTA
jgi:antitoxin HicB